MFNKFRFLTWACADWEWGKHGWQRGEVAGGPRRARGESWFAVVLMSFCEGWVNGLELRALRYTALHPAL